MPPSEPFRVYMAIYFLTRHKQLSRRQLPVLQREFCKTCRRVALMKTFVEAESDCCGRKFHDRQTRWELVTCSWGGVSVSPLQCVSLVLSARVPTGVQLCPLWGSSTWEGVNNYGHSKMWLPATILQHYKNRNRHAILILSDMGCSGNCREPSHTAY
jgi:hypothetical protein